MAGPPSTPSASWAAPRNGGTSAPSRRWRSRPAASPSSPTTSSRWIRSRRPWPATSATSTPSATSPRTRRRAADTVACGCWPSPRATRTSRCGPAAGTTPPNSARRASRSEPAPAPRRLRALLHHDVDQLAWHHNGLHHLLAVERGPDLFIRQRELTYRLLGTVGGDGEPRAQFAVHLHRDLDLVLLGQRRVELRPGRAQQVRLLSQDFPQFVRQVGREGRQQQHQVALEVAQAVRRDGARGNLLLGAVELVHQLHDGGDGGVEVPAPLEVLAHPLDGLVQLALERASYRRGGLCGRGRPARAVTSMFHHEAIDARKEAADALDARLLPVQVAVG